LATKNASKVLRAKSAYIQIFTRLVAYRICHELGISHDHVLSTSAGKFEILSHNKEGRTLERVSKRLNDHFIEKFFGLSGIGMSWVECVSDDFTRSDRYRALRDKVAQSVEEKKFEKFGLPGRSSLLDYEEGLDNATLCRVCNMRKVDKHDRCKICNDFVKLGEKLTKENLIHFVEKDPDIEIFDGWGVSFTDAVQNALATFDISKDSKSPFADWPLSSYVAKDEREGIADFETLAQAAVKEIADGKKGIAALGVLKADVDDMGRFIKESDVTDSYDNFIVFSEGLDNFFSIEVPRIMAQKYPNTYTVFAGGDDLFVVGAWNEILDLSREVSDAFSRFVEGKLTLSFGIVLVKPGTPVNYMADSAEAALEASKEHRGKNAITLFGQTVGNDEYRRVGKTFYATLKKSDEELFELPTAFLYRLLELLAMRQRMEKEENFMEGSMWKSKLAYAFRRNVFDRLGEKEKQKRQLAETLLKNCHDMIENHPAICRMVLSEFIYKRRKAA